jgi:GNAT superfamily N-acetyltransferase
MVSDNKTLLVRRFNSADVEAVSYLIIKALNEINSKDYSAQVIQNLTKAYSPDNILKKSNCQLMYVAVVDGQIRGTVSLKDDVIVGLFVDPTFMRQGIGRYLVNHIEAVAQQYGIRKILTRSSVTAFDFYRYCGYHFV